MEKGRLIYETPPDKPLHKIIAISLFVTYVILTTILIIMGLTSVSSIVLSVIGAIAVYGGLFFLFTIPIAHFIHPRFRIYETGITEIVTELMLPFKEEGKIILYSQMKAFEGSPKGQRCIIYLEPKGKIQYLDKRKKVIDILKDNLRKHGIKEVPSNCSR